MLLLGLRPASGSPAAPAAAEPRAAFSNGQAKATAIVTKIGPGVGNLELALGSGVAVSELKNDLAQAQAQSLDLGLIGTTLTSDGCSAAPLRQDQLPQPTRVDNREGDASATTDYAPVAGETLGGGRGFAQATKTPSATAVATAAASDGPAVSIGGGKATAVTEVIDHAERQAHATVEMDLKLAGGALELSNLRWDALHRTGKKTRAEATFDIGTAKLAGVAIPLDSLKAAQDAINAALEETGISIEMPHVERFEKPTDLVRITPLLVTLRDSPAGKAALGPGLNASREQREQMFNDLSSAICEAAGVLLVGDIGVSIASGTGFVTYGFGGAEAISGDFILENPFGTAIAPPTQSVTPPASGVVPVAPAAGPAAPPAAAATTPSAQGQQIADVGPLEQLCESVHPFQWPDCSKGAMAPLGLLGLFATTGVAALDWRHQRRRLSAVAGPSEVAGAS
ncbi:MAG: hypothetical protein ACJ739_13030 [Acidimicrobiales bacterium]